MKLRLTYGEACLVRRMLDIAAAEAAKVHAAAVKAGDAAAALEAAAVYHGCETVSTRLCDLGALN